MNTKSINDKIALYPILNDVKQALILKNVSDRTVTNYMDGIARFLDFIKYDNLFEITEDHFRNYLFYLHSCNFSKITINTYNSFIRFFFNAVLNTAINPYRVPMAKFIPKDIDFLFDHQISSLLSVSFHDSRLDCIIKLALCCGLRINEVISLKVSDISTKDRSNMTVYIRESKKIVPVLSLWIKWLTVLFSVMPKNIVSALIPIAISLFFLAYLIPVTKLSEDILISAVMLPESLALLLFIV